VALRKSYDLDNHDQYLKKSPGRKQSREPIYYIIRKGRVKKLSEESKENQTYVTSDIGIAAYLQMFDVKLLKCHRLPGGRFHFEFDNPEECKKRSIEFLSSEFCRFDNNVRNLKKLLFS
tara:strand:+ start:1680 stop:2036 length:357 start_codon:yes stop_codon:yes gene_type:complete